MTASLKLPCIKSLIDGLDGAEPGSSLLDFVQNHIEWHPWADKHGRSIAQHSVGSALTLRLSGELSLPQGTHMSVICDCVVEEPLDGFTAMRVLPEHTEMKMEVFEGSSRCVSISMRDGHTLGSTLVTATLAHDSYKFPIWGYPHPEERKGEVCDALQTQLKWLRSGAEGPLRLNGTTDGRMFLARMYLAAGIYRRGSKSNIWGLNLRSAPLMPEMGTVLERAIRLTRHKPLSERV